MDDDVRARLGDHFSVRDARIAGLTRGVLRSRSLERPFHGIRTRSDAEPMTIDRRGRELGDLEQEHLHRAFARAAEMGHGCFTHVTAAVVWGLPLPRALVEEAPIDVGVFEPARLSRSRGVRGHQLRSRLTRVRKDPHTGLRVAAPATTWAMLASVLVDLDDLVAVGDAVIRDWRVAEPLATHEELAAAVDAGRRPGVVQLRRALPLVRTRSASRPETRLRLAITGAGLPEPELNFEVWDDGLYLGAVDLAYPKHRLAIEYEGEHHLLDPVQWARDIERYDRLRSAGWVVIRVTKTHLFATPEIVVQRVRWALSGRR